MSDLVPLSIDTLENGDFRKQIDQELKAMVNDVIVRDRLDSPREMTIKIRIKPNIQSAGDRVKNTPIIEGRILRNALPWKSTKTHALVREGNLLISMDNPKEPLQRSLLSQDEIE
jgi:hypothetical protein